jgi:hypothetical protein
MSVSVFGMGLYEVFVIFPPPDVGLPTPPFWTSLTLRRPSLETDFDWWPVLVEPTWIEFLLPSTSLIFVFLMFNFAPFVPVNTPPEDGIGLALSPLVRTDLLMTSRAPS